VRISIITPSYQQAPYLEECLCSVREQEGVEVEHIVVDGGSTDGSRAIIERHAHDLAWWCSEKDAGQSDAINKGLARATGQAITWVNSDDALLPGALAQVARAFTDDPALRVFGGRIVHRDATGDRPFALLNDASDAYRIFCDPVINQPATFYRTDVLKELGGVDPALRYVMDLGLWWRLLFTHGTAHLRFDHSALAAFRLHGESKTTTAHTGFLDETASLLHDMAGQLGDERWAAPLEALHTISPGLRPIPVGEQDRPMVQRMILRFLLKWHGHIHRREQYRALRAFAAWVEGGGVDQGAWERERMTALRAQLEPASWIGFRVRRKLEHLRR
jgi:hypothetical protein